MQNQSKRELIFDTQEQNDLTTSPVELFHQFWLVNKDNKLTLVKPYDGFKEVTKLWSFSLSAFSPVSYKTVNNVSSMNFNNQHCVELLAVIFCQVWLTNLKIRHRIQCRYINISKALQVHVKFTTQVTFCKCDG